MTTQQDYEILEGIIERITFHSEETGYTVAKLKVPKSDKLITAVGEMAAIHAGEELRLKGQWANHPKHGYQFKLSSYEKLMPATAVGLQKYLGSGLIKGIGPITAKRLIKAFGTDIIQIIEEEPERLKEVPKIGPKKQKIIVSGWNEQREIQNVMLFLQGNGVSTTYAVKIYKKYGDRAVEIVQNNPYQLAEDIWGIGFKTADTIAQHLGFAPDSLHRLRAGILYALNRASEDGHIFLPQDELLKRTVTLLEIEDNYSEELLKAIQALGKEDFIRLDANPDNPYVYLTPLFRAEAGVAQQLNQLLQTKASKTVTHPEKTLKKLQSKNQMTLSPEQERAVLTAVQEKLLILTGGPGTGKTTVSQTIIAIFEQAGLKVLLASPTGRAAKRLAEVTGKTAKTIHRLLKFDPKTFGFKKNETDPLEADVLLLDEISMVDNVLFYNLLKAVPKGAYLILVGDRDQLPSVGPGAILNDLIESGKIPVACLTTIFRQAQSSLIVTNAHRVNQGEAPKLLPPTPQNRKEDAFFMEEFEPESIATTIQNLMVKRLPKAGHAPDDIQILCPMNRGLIGTQQQNKYLQELLNPSSPTKGEIIRGSRCFREDDRIIQLRNNYDLNVFNGDMGKINIIDGENQTLSVNYPEGEIKYDFSDLDELALAYALSVHKSQGSEYPVVIMPLSTQHYAMLQRNLIYTAMTRAKKLLILVGTKRAMWIAIKNNKIAERFTGLAERLKELIS